MIDAWSREPQPQEFRRGSTGGFDDLLDVIRKQGDRLRDSTKNLLGSAGIRLKPGRMVVEQSLDIEGDFTATGNTTIGGNARITGTLSLPAGIIDNDALANPIVPAGASNTVTAFGLSTTESVVVSASAVVPAGFSRCLATGLGSIFFLNPTAAVDYVYARVFIEAPGQSWWGIRPLSMVGPGNGSAALAPNWMVLLEGLNAGDVVTFSLRARTGFEPMSASSNLGGITGQCLFFR